MIVRWSVVCVVVLFAYLWYKFPTNNKLVYPEIFYTIDELAKSNGYPFEYHKVTTIDSYILELHRIPHGKQNKENAKRPPILLMHGMALSSASYLINGANSLPYYLADRGFDVWLGNARGNYYSRQHVVINPNRNPREFFNFSWHEIGNIDLPNMIDYILHRVHHQKLFYLGHSQGCTAFHVTMSEKPEYNEKVHLMLAFAPTVFLKTLKSHVLILLVKLQRLLEWSSELFGYYEALSCNLTNFGNTFCQDGMWTQMLCYLPFGLSAGFNIPQVNWTLLPLLMAHSISGMSFKQYSHYAQIFKSDIFRQYDYGEETNEIIYGQSTPPIYKLENTKVPVAMFLGDNDLIVSERDIDVLCKLLPNVVYKYIVPDELFSHIDFITAINAKDILYPIVLEVLNEYQSIISQP